MKYAAFLILCLSAVLNIYGQNPPTLNEIINTFFTSYSFTGENTYPKFLKKKDGWHIAEDNYNDPGNFKTQSLFWSHKVKSYLTLNYPIAEDDASLNSSQIEEYKKLIDYANIEYQYSRNKYYGYPGWDWDIINDPVYKTKMTDSSWESLARAYSNYASGFLFDQSGDLFQNADPDRLLLKDPEPITKTRISKFITYITKAIEAYRNIIQINPKYQTKVGNIKLKCANEYMFAYFDLLLAGDTTSANRFLSNIDYPDSVINTSKIYLDAISKNGILFTGGDNDTYPLWYLQKVKQYRPDVLVINTSLLGLRRYVNMLDRQQNLKLFTTKDTTYYKANFDYSLYRKPKEDSKKIEAGKFIAQLNLYSPILSGSNDLPVYKGEVIKVYNSKELYFISPTPHPGSGTEVAISKIVVLDDYLIMSDFMILDIINTNLSSRSIYFTYSHSLFDNVSQLEGPVYKVVAIEK